LLFLHFHCEGASGLAGAFQFLRWEEALRSSNKNRENNGIIVESKRNELERAVVVHISIAGRVEVVGSAWSLLVMLELRLHYAKNLALRTDGPSTCTSYVMLRRYY